MTKRGSEFSERGSQTGLICLVFSPCSSSLRSSDPTKSFYYGIKQDNCLLPWSLVGEFKTRKRCHDGLHFTLGKKRWGHNPAIITGILSTLLKEKRQNLTHLNELVLCSQLFCSNVYVTLTTHFILMITPFSRRQKLLRRNDQSFTTVLYDHKMTYPFYTKSI